MLYKEAYLQLNRRQVLISLGLAAFHRAVWPQPTPLWSTLRERTLLGHDANEVATDDTIEGRLRADLARLAPRVYSEEGIPVFLACVNLVPAKPLHPAPAVTLLPLSAALASTFRRNARALQRIRPGAEAKDIAPLIEVLADRDFSRGKTTEQS